VANDPPQDVRDAGDPDRDVQGRQARLRHPGCVDDREPREAVRVIEGAAHAQIAAERAGDGEAAVEAGRRLKLADERRECGAVMRALRRGLAAAGARQAGRDDTTDNDRRPGEQEIGEVGCCESAVCQISGPGNRRRVSSPTIPDPKLEPLAPQAV
jgi:hypothetical protein